MNVINKILLFVCVLFSSGCASTLPKLETVDNVDLDRFMGAWYVIACIPTAIEKKAYNGVEEYKMLDNGVIDTTFTFNKGGFDGPVKTYNPKGFIVDEIHNSTWGMRFVWPFKAEYLITYLNSDYTQTIVGRNKRDYFWIMARSPQIPDEDYQRLLMMLEEQGYDMEKVRKVPQRWDAKK